MRNSAGLPLARRRRQVSPLSGLVLGFLLTTFILAFAYTGYLVYDWARSSVVAPSIKDLTIPRVNPQVMTETGEGTVVVPAVPAQAPRQTPNLRRKERINILVLGADQRPDDIITARTDTIIVVTVDPAQRTVGMLSLPRDLWVTIPGFGEGKINTAFPIAETRHLAGGGPALAKATVEQLLGYPIHYYVWLNFDGFRRLIDAIGGITVDVPKEINDPKFPDNAYGYDPLHIAAGSTHMDGELALKYARTRHMDNDYGRAGRQQQVLLAIKEQLFQKDAIRTILPKVPGLIVNMAKSIRTDIPLDQMASFVDLARTLDLEHVQQAMLDDKTGTESNTPETGWILVPDPARYRPVVDRLFAPVPVPTPQKTGSINQDQVVSEFLAAEGARIIVLNGTAREGLASRTSDWLRARGFQVIGFGNAERSDYARSVLLDHTGKAFAVQTLKELFQITSENLRVDESQQSSADIRLIVGADFKLPGE